jgi:hypothetical protein
MGEPQQIRNTEDKVPSILNKFTKNIFGTCEGFSSKWALRESRQQVIQLHTITGRVQRINNFISSYRLI